MPAVTRFGDADVTHCPGMTRLDKSSHVFANGIDIAVIGAPTVSHAFPPDPPCNPHTAQLNAGSATVWINGIKVGRIDDSADAGAMTTGSPDVTAGP